MKLTLALCMALCVSVAWGQGYIWDIPWPQDRGHFVTDSTVWRVTHVAVVGDSTCQHDWAEGEFTTARPGISRV